MDVAVGVPVHYAKEKPPINVVGDVSGRIAIMVVCILIVLNCRHSDNYQIEWEQLMSIFIPLCLFFFSKHQTG